MRKEAKNMKKRQKQEEKQAEKDTFRKLSKNERAQFEKVQKKLETSLRQFHNYIMKYGKQGDKEYKKNLLDTYLEAEKQIQSYKVKNENTNDESSNQEPNQREESQSQQQSESSSSNLQSIEDSISNSFSSHSLSPILDINFGKFEDQYKNEKQKQKLNWNPCSLMTSREKTDYFDKINKTYKKDIKKKKGQGKKKDQNEKYVKFSSNILYKKFKKSDEPMLLKAQRQDYEILIKEFWQYD